jgi:hypothetical protein
MVEPTKIPPEGIKWEGQFVCTLNFPYVIENYALNNLRVAELKKQ